MSGFSTRFTSPPSTSLIICSRNRPKLLLECIESVLKGEELPTELCIIDQSDVPHPTLPGLRATRSCDIRYIWSQSIGLSRGRNAGIAVSRHDILSFTDDDMIMPLPWFRLLIRAFLEAGSRAIVTGRVLATAADTPGGFAPSTNSDEAPAVYEGRVGKDVLWANMAIHRSALATVGGFDERLGAGSHFPSSEDNDMGFRLLEAGYRIVYVPEVVLYHRAWRTQRDHVSIGWNYGRGQGAYYAKHLRLADRYMLWRLIRDILDHLGRAPRRVWQRELHRLMRDVAYALGVVSGAAEWLWTQPRTR
jgi:O-antigen biosynthesis protein